MKLLKFLIILLLPLSVFADDIFVNGASQASTETIEFQGATSENVSPSNKARIYFNRDDDKLKISEDGGAYKNILSGTEPSVLYVPYIGATKNLDMGSYNISTDERATADTLTIRTGTTESFIVTGIATVDTLIVGTLTDGTLSITDGNITSAESIVSGTYSDGFLSITGGDITNAGDITLSGTLSTGTLLIDGTLPDDLYVNITGDTMTGQLQATTLTDGS